MSQSELNNIHQRYLNDNIFTKKILLEIIELLKKQEDNMSNILRNRSYNSIRNIRTNRLFNNLNSNSRNIHNNIDNINRDSNTDSNTGSNTGNNTSTHTTSFRLNNIPDIFDLVNGLANVSNVTIHRVHTNTTDNSNSTQSNSLLTLEQINDILEDITFSDIPDDITRYLTCPITQTTFRPSTEISRIKECGHYFQKNAIRNWFCYNSTCPVCRKNLIPISHESTSSFGPSESISNTSNPDVSNPTTTQSLVNNIREMVTPVLFNIDNRENDINAEI